jgi:hypothetical protein
MFNYHGEEKKKKQEEEKKDQYTSLAHRHIDTSTHRHIDTSTDKTPQRAFLTVGIMQHDRIHGHGVLVFRTAVAACLQR